MIGDRSRFYPLGTAVRTKNSNLISIIIGLLPKLPDGQVADYLTVHYPCGYDGTADSLYLLNAECITEVLSSGYLDEGFEFLAAHITEIEAKAHETASRAQPASASILD